MVRVMTLPSEVVRNVFVCEGVEIGVVVGVEGVEGGGEGVEGVGDGGGVEVDVLVCESGVEGGEDVEVSSEGVLEGEVVVDVELSLEGVTLRGHQGLTFHGCCHTGHRTLTVGGEVSVFRAKGLGCGRKGEDSPGDLWWFVLTRHLWLAGGVTVWTSAGESRQPKHITRSLSANSAETSHPRSPPRPSYVRQFCVVRSADHGVLECMFVGVATWAALTLLEHLDRR